MDSSTHSMLCLFWNCNPILSLINLITPPRHLSDWLIHFPKPVPSLPPYQLFSLRFPKVTVSYHNLFLLFSTDQHFVVRARFHSVPFSLFQLVFRLLPFVAVSPRHISIRSPDYFPFFESHVALTLTCPSFFSLRFPVLSWRQSFPRQVLPTAKFV